MAEADTFETNSSESIEVLSTMEILRIELIARLQKMKEEPSDDPKEVFFQTMGSDFSDEANYFLIEQINQALAVNPNMHAILVLGNYEPRKQQKKDDRLRFGYNHRLHLIQRQLLPEGYHGNIAWSAYPWNPLDRYMHDFANAHARVYYINDGKTKTAYIAKDLTSYQAGGLFTPGIRLTDTTDPEGVEHIANYIRKQYEIAKRPIFQQIIRIRRNIRKESPSGNAFLMNDGIVGNTPTRREDLRIIQEAQQGQTLYIETPIPPLGEYLKRIIAARERGVIIHILTREQQTEVIQQLKAKGALVHSPHFPNSNDSTNSLGQIFQSRIIAPNQQVARFGSLSIGTPEELMPLLPQRWGRNTEFDLVTTNPTLVRLLEENIQHEIDLIKKINAFAGSRNMLTQELKEKERADYLTRHPDIQALYYRAIAERAQ